MWSLLLGWDLADYGMIVYDYWWYYELHVFFPKNVFIMLDMIFFWHVCGDYSFQWVEFTVNSSQGLQPMEELERQQLFTLLQFWNTWQQRFLNWLVMQARIWKWRGSPPDICSWQFVEMRNLTPLLKGPLLVVVSSLTFTNHW